MTEIKPYMCSCCHNIWSRENQKNIKLGEYELRLCPDCYHEYIISNSKALDKIRAEIEEIADEEQKHDEKWATGLRYAIKIIDKYGGVINV